MVESFLVLLNERLWGNGRGEEESKATAHFVLTGRVNNGRQVLAGVGGAKVRAGLPCGSVHALGTALWVFVSCV